VEPDAAAFFAAPRAVFYIALDVKAEPRKLGANLVAAARQELYLHKKIAPPLPQDAVAENRLFPFRAFFIAGYTFIAPAPLYPVNQSAFFRYSGGRRGHFRYGPVCFIAVPAGKGGVQTGEGFPRTGKEAAARYRNIHALNRLWHFRLPHRAGPSLPPRVKAELPRQNRRKVYHTRTRTLGGFSG
jgi:hypothetical protein